MHDYGAEEDISVEGLIEEQRRLSRSKNPFERVVGTLCVAGVLKQDLPYCPMSGRAVDVRSRLERTKSSGA